MNNASILSLFRSFSVSSLILLTLIGCSVTLIGCSIHRIIAPQKCPEPVFYAEPDYPVKRLTEADKANYGAVAKAYAVSLKQCVMQENLYKMQLKGYKHE